VEALVGAGVFYGGGITEAPALARQQAYVVGAGNSAGQAAVNLAKYAHRVTMIVRGDGLGATMSDYLIRTITATANIDVLPHTAVVDGRGTDRLQELVLREAATGQRRTVPATALFVLIGAHPHTDWLPRASTAIGTASCSPARTCPPFTPRSLSRPACPACSRPATSGTARSNAWRPQSATAASASDPYTSAWPGSAKPKPRPARTTSVRSYRLRRNPAPIAPAAT
jgi:hypothetical protein